MENISPNSNLDAALALASAGLFIFPTRVSLKTDGKGWEKKPLIGGWKSRATTDLSMIEQWWRTYQHAVPGIELGRSGLVVLDGDRHGGPDGVTALNEMLGADAPRHPISLTAGGGEHHIFRQPENGEPLGNSTGSLPKGIDVRGQGGWIVAPGSIRPDGKPWQSDPEAPSLPEAFSSGTIPAIPEHIINLIRPAPSLVSKVEQPTISQRAVAQIAPVSQREQSYGAALLNGVCSDVSAAREGTRNETLNAGAYRAGRAVASGLLDRNMAEQKLFSAAEVCGLVADDKHAVLATMRSGLDAGVQKPLAPLADRPPIKGPQSNVIAFPAAQAGILHWHSNDKRVMPRWLVKNMLPETGLALMSGQWSAGKTFMALHLANCVWTGEPFAGQKVKRRGGTLFLAAEGAGQLKIRLDAIAAPPLSGKHELLPFVWIEAVPTLSEPGALAKLVAFAREADAEMQARFGVPLALVEIDTMSAAAGFEDENAAADTQPVMNMLHALSGETSVLVIAVDHFGKSVSAGTRGSGAKEASADAVLALTASDDDKQHTLTVRKLRSGARGGQFGFSLRQVSFGLDDDGDEITTCVVEFSPDPVNAPSTDAWRGLTALRQAIEVGLGINREEITPFGMEGPLVEATQYELVRDEFFKAYSADGDPDKKYATRKRAFNRQIKSARERHLICTREVGGEQVIWFGREPVPVNKSGTGRDTP